MPFLRRHATASVLVAVSVLAPCRPRRRAPGVAGAAPAPVRAAHRPVAKYAKPGPYRAGVTTLTIGDRKADVWYPIAPKAARKHHKDVYEIAKWLPRALQDLVASKGVRAPFTTDAYRGVKVSSRGPFPLVVFAHGFGGYRDQSTFLTTHLATWGFVVASPDFLERGLGAQLGDVPATPRTEKDVIDSTLAAVRRASARGRGPLTGAVRPHGRIAITGHSAGGRTAITYGAQRDVVTYIPLAGAAAAFGDPRRRRRRPASPRCTSPAPTTGSSRPRGSVTSTGRCPRPSGSW